MNPLVQLAEFGQSFWLDYIRRGFVEGGELRSMIELDGLRGLTSNPSIFEKAIADSADYAQELSAVRTSSPSGVKQLYELLTLRDIRGAADLLMPLYERTQSADGYVSFEISPELAGNTQGTVEDARRLWKSINRANLMLKVPGTKAGLAAVQTLLTEGINVNITLLFSQQVYRQTAEAYLRAIEERVERGLQVATLASVASFFVSRIDTAVDAILVEKGRTATEPERDRIEGLMGKAAIANARCAYRIFQEMFSGPRWDRLSAKGARPQRLLWASTSTKNPAYRDVLYIEELIGAQTVNTMPPATATAFKQHGKLRNSLQEDPDGAARTLKELQDVNVSLDDITSRLLTEGVKSFAGAYNSLLDAIQTEVAA